MPGSKKRAQTFEGSISDNQNQKSNTLPKSFGRVFFLFPFAYLLNIPG